MIKTYDSQQAYDNAAEPYDDWDEDGVTQEQKQTLSEYDEDIAKLEQQLIDLLERRERYVNRNGLGERIPELAQTSRCQRSVAEKLFNSVIRSTP